MPRNENIKKVLVIGSGPIIIGQAAEFDYAGTQACTALREEGIITVLVNSNPATIMTDINIADKVYIEPLNIEILKKIIRKEKPDSILPTLGGQTGLNMAIELHECGFLDEVGVKLLGTAVEAIKMAEDRQQFKDMMERINEPCIASKVVESIEDALLYAEVIDYPVIVRPAYTLGGTGGGIAYNKDELKIIAGHGIRYSRVDQILVEKCISGWKEIEYEVMRDGKGNVITVCNMENIDPVGIHTGDSIVVAPSQTLSDKEYQMLRTASLNIISSLGIEGGCNVQLALHPESFEYAVIEVNPRVSRSSALASKATGYPIAKVASKIAIGYGLDEIVNAVTGKTYACFEPTLDYCVMKIPKWPFDKFIKAERKLGTQMKATGEVMAISSNFEASLLKAVRSLELGIDNFDIEEYEEFTTEEILEKIGFADDERLFLVASALRRGISCEQINSFTKIDMFFLNKINNIVIYEEKLKKLTLKELTPELILRVKQLGFTDKAVSKFISCDMKEFRETRLKYNIKAVFKMVDTCAAEFKAVTPYYYSTYDQENESIPTNNKKAIVIGSGPIRIGQGIEFDYCSVHSVWALKEQGYETIIINNNPETVSTDFDTSDRLYFEPLTEEDVFNVVQNENPDFAILQFGGQTAIKLTMDVHNMGVKILGTQAKNVDAAEDREKFDLVLEKTGIPRPKGKTIFTLNEAIKEANELIYPVIVRPSYVLGGKGMEIAFCDKDITEYMSIINIQKNQKHPILIDKYMMGKEIEVDAICDGNDILIPGIMEHLERAGVHSGDSISIYPPISLNERIINELIDYTRRLAKELEIIGMVNIQYVLYNDKIYVIEVNPRSSRTVPYISKVTGIPMINLATRVMMGEKLKDMGYGTGLCKPSEYYAIKVPVFSFNKLIDVDTGLGPEMKSTGEVLGISKNIDYAMLKGLAGSGLDFKSINNDKTKGVLLTVRDNDKNELVPLAEKLEKLGFILYGTGKTANYLNKYGIATNAVKKISEGDNNVLSLIELNRVSFVINTPTKGKQPSREGFKIRRKTVECNIPCLTSLDTARAFINCLEKKETLSDMDIVELHEINEEGEK